MTSPMHAGSRLVAFVLTVLMIAGCGSGSASSTTTTATTTAAAQATTSSAMSATTTVAPTTTAAATSTTVAPTTTLLEPSRLLGTWLTSSGTLLLTFNENGTHEVSYLAGKPFDFGPYELDGSQLRLTSAEASEVCAGLTGTYDAAMSAEGEELRFSFISDRCFERANELASPATRHSP